MTQGILLFYAATISKNFSKLIKVKNLSIIYIDLFELVGQVTC